MVCIARGVSLVENGFAVELLFDPAMEARLRALWKALAQAEVSSSMLDIGARPHVSLAVFERLDPTSMHAELDGFARENPPLEVTLSAVGTFPGAEGAVFIAPVVTPEMLDLHKRFHRRLAELSIPSLAYYHPSNWTPHCTAAMEMPPDKIPAAVEICRNADVFGSARLVEVELIAFRPVRRLYAFPLGG
jgi:2'-5' RNA ligase